MARWTYAFSNGSYNDWHRRFPNLAGIDIDFIEVCPKCYQPLAVKETCYDKGQVYKATTLTKIVANALQIKRITEPVSAIYELTQDEWLAYLYELHNEHRRCCKNATEV